jgi:GDSL-like Lipase/Acylhydrolase family
MNWSLSERQKEVATGLTILAVTALTFAAGEILLRVVQMSKFGTATTVEESDKFVEDSVTGLRLPAPGSEHGRIHYNSLGFRGPELAMPKPAGTIRIAYLGNSTTLDAYAGDAESWPAVATAVVRRSAGECGVDHLNAGVAGFATDRMRRYFEGRVRQTEPDVVVVLPRDINLDLDTYVVSHGMHDGVHYRPSWLARHSVLWSKIELNATIIRRLRAAKRPKDSAAIPAHAVVAEFEPRLRALVGEIRRSGQLPVLLAVSGQVRRDQSKPEQLAAAETDLFYMPYMTIEGLLDLRDEYNRVIREVGAGMGAAVIDAHLAVPGDKRHFQDSLHFAPTGSAMAGRVIGEELVELPAIRQKIARCAVRTEGN